jgi:TetR/AcrR family transcriptional regulator, transcriptional repressor for nem operon
MPQRSVRDKIVQHAEDVFRRQGFSASSVHDVTSAAGVPKGSFYNHFPSKEDLAKEILLRYAQGTDMTMLTAGEGPVRERLRRHFAQQRARTERTGAEYGCLLGTFGAETAVSGGELRAAADEVYAFWVENIARAVAEGQRAGEIRSDVDAGSLAGFLIDGFEGATLRSKVTGQARPLDDFMSITFDRLLA